MTGNNELEQLRLYKALAEEHGLSVFEDMATLKRKGDLYQQAYNEAYDQLQEVKNQRDELLAVLNSISWLQAGDQLGSSDVEAIRAAITGVKGSAA